MGTKGKPETKATYVECECGLQVGTKGLSKHKRTCFWPRTLERIFELGGVDVAGDGCWTWQTTANGRKAYPYVGHRLHREEVSHLILELRGELPLGPKEVVRHTCDNSPCVRPSHLMRGTQADNVRDMHERGRASYGIEHSRKIREAWAKRQEDVDLMQEYRILLAERTRKQMRDKRAVWVSRPCQLCGETLTASNPNEPVGGMLGLHERACARRLGVPRLR